MLTQIVLAFEVFAAHLARERHLGTLVRTLVDHQIVGFGEASLAILADEFALWSHLTTKVRPAIIVINSHHRKHCGWSLVVAVSMGWMNMMMFSRCFVIGLRWAHTRAKADTNERTNTHTQVESRVSRARHFMCAARCELFARPSVVDWIESNDDDVDRLGSGLIMYEILSHRRRDPQDE